LGCTFIVRKATSVYGKKNQRRNGLRNTSTKVALKNGIEWDDLIKLSIELSKYRLKNQKTKKVKSGEDMITGPQKLKDL